MKTFIPRLILSATLLAPVATTTVLMAQEHKVYHDKERNEDHEWNDREDKAYRMWVKEQHRKYRDFSKLNEEEQRKYWEWRREHSDAVLHIDIK